MFEEWGWVTFTSPVKDRAHFTRFFSKAGTQNSQHWEFHPPYHQTILFYIQLFFLCCFKVKKENIRALNGPELIPWRRKSQDCIWSFWGNCWLKMYVFYLMSVEINILLSFGFISLVPGFFTIRFFFGLHVWNRLSLCPEKYISLTLLIVQIYLVK